MSVGRTETIHARIILTSTSTRLTRNPTLSFSIAHLCCPSHIGVTANGTWFTGGRRVCNIARMSARATGAIARQSVEQNTFFYGHMARGRRIGLVLFVAVVVYLVLNVTLPNGGSPDVPNVVVCSNPSDGSHFIHTSTLQAATCTLQHTQCNGRVPSMERVSLDATTLQEWLGCWLT